MGKIYVKYYLVYLYIMVKCYKLLLSRHILYKTNCRERFLNPKNGLSLSGTFLYPVKGFSEYN